MVNVIGWLARHTKQILYVAMFIVVLAILYRFRRLFGLKKSRKVDDKKAAIEEARHFYGQMLTILQRESHFRRVDQTPEEFLDELRAKKHEKIDLIEIVTTKFCSIRYGNALLTADDRIAVQEAINSLAKKGTTADKAV